MGCTLVHRPARTLLLETMRSSARARGYTLIELMLVVALVAVLATLAIFGYRKWVRGAHVAEGQDMVAAIRAAEERYYAENGAYLSVTTGLGDGYTYPSPHPSNFATAWGGSCSTCVGSGYTGLGVTSSAPVFFGYSTIADSTKTAQSLVGTKTTNGATIDLSQMGNGQPWYFVEADANISGDKANYMHVYGMSATNTIFVDGEGN
jgi:prepilin-type N-terminal cleavage/methylation domain-containing protein